MCLDYYNKNYHIYLLFDDNQKLHNKKKENFNDDDDLRSTQRNKMIFFKFDASGFDLKLFIIYLMNVFCNSSGEHRFKIRSRKINLVRHCSVKINIFLLAVTQAHHLWRN